MRSYLKSVRIAQSFKEGNGNINIKLLRRELSSEVGGSLGSSKNPPIFQQYRSIWPNADYFTNATNTTVPELPIRTVKEENLKFTMKSSFHPGSSVFYPHLKINPADAKVKMEVCQRSFTVIFPNNLILGLHR
jgi:hypothetical protein